MLNDLISRIRRNHALEHATLHLLTSRFKRFGVQGNASVGGFYLNLYAPHITREAVEKAAKDALNRMKGGEHSLALHPNCGTVYLTTAAMATAAAQATFSIDRRVNGRTQDDWFSVLNVFPTAVLAVFVALIVSRPIGMELQKLTTDGIPGTLEVIEVREVSPNLIARFFRVVLGQTQPVQSYFIQTAG